MVPSASAPDTDPGRAPNGPGTTGRAGERTGAARHAREVGLYVAREQFNEMGLKCSLLGHSFGESTVEHEREERGSEVVTSTREVAVCERCGEKRVLSENKEVTAVIDEADLETDDAADETGATDEPEPEPDGDDLVSRAVDDVRSESDVAGGMDDIDVPDDDGAADAPAGGGMRAAG